ncbi:acyltransferase family protein [Nostocoides jenkinsii]|uniref:Predicted acyltransferase n=1 Tax=Nostocoides jenkinsii Ben 74 TaxID=1193518 RepID=A0A077MCA6_9MICO|nr:acyltransferase family protein [Tetrasphaera jenkinsii]CCI53485.1 Predicted acyltransferase [Tetrasphaera jenkinsii Ben 74]
MADRDSAAGFRADVEGLRAIAVLTVMWFHAGLGGLTGGFAGVDIFFVISGFLITGQLVREVEASGRISLPRFYARRAKRLFPAAATVLVATAVLTLLALPRVTWRDTGGDLVAAAAYVVNWRLAARSVDYLATDTAHSPVQQFWSLAVEEQYYLLWPVLLTLVAVLIRRWRLPVRPMMGVGLAAITIPSLAWSIHLTSSDPARAYFVTTTRLWELGIGALVAVGAPVCRALPPRVGAALAWAGLALIGVGLWTQDTTTSWPGSAALVPVLGAAAVIAGGAAGGWANVGGAAVGGVRGGGWGPVALLGIRPLVWIGGLSYSLYLWHWPLVVVATHVFDGLAPWQGAAVVAASVVPAWVTQRLIENPLRFHPAVVARTRTALLLGLVCSLVGVGTGATLLRAGGHSGFAPIDLSSIPVSRAGAGVLGTGATPRPVEIDQHPVGVTPDPLRAPDDAPRLYADDCQVELAPVEVKVCRYGSPGSSKVLALVGDSKAAQWFPAIERFADTHGWEVRTYLKSSCPWSPALIYGGVDADHRYVACQEWGRAVLARLSGPERPTVVVTSGIRRVAYAPDGTEQLSVMVDGYVDYWQRLGRLGVPVVAVMDTPQPGLTAYVCMTDHPGDFMTRCRGAWNTGSGGLALVEAVKRVPTARLIDMNPWVCPQQGCWPVIGHVLVWRQSAHLTATYVETLAPVFDARLTAALRELRVPAG